MEVLKHLCVVPDVFLPSVYVQRVQERRYGGKRQPQGDVSEISCSVGACRTFFVVLEMLQQSYRGC